MTGAAGLLQRLRGANALSILERFINRGSSAVVSVAMIFFVSATEVGIYAGAMLVYTLTQNLGEIAIRYTAPQLWRTTDGPRALRRTVFFSAAISAAASIGYAVFVFAVGTASAGQALTVSALALGAIAGNLAQPRLTYAQAQGAWGLIAHRQTLAAGVSLMVGLAVVPWYGIAGGIAQSVVLEVAFFLALPRAGALAADGPARPPPYVQIRHMSWNNGLGWLQTQSERVTVGAAAGAATLGVYSVAFQLGRSLVEPVAGGLINVLRNDLAASAGHPEVQRSTFDRSVSRSALIGLGLQGATCAVLILPLAAVLPATWHQSVQAAALLSGGLPLVMAAWTMPILLIVRGETRRLIPWQVLGVALSAAAGLVMAWSLWAGIIALIVRDAIGVGGRGWLARGDVSAHAFWRLGAATCGSFALAAGVWAVLPAIWSI